MHKLRRIKLLINEAVLPCAAEQNRLLAPPVSVNEICLTGVARGLTW